MKNQDIPVVQFNCFHFSSFSFSTSEGLALSNQMVLVAERSISFVLSNVAKMLSPDKIQENIFRLRINDSYWSRIGPTTCSCNHNESTNSNCDGLIWFDCRKCPLCCNPLWLLMTVNTWILFVKTTSNVGVVAWFVIICEEIKMGSENCEPPERWETTSRLKDRCVITSQVRRSEGSFLLFLLFYLQVNNCFPSAEMIVLCGWFQVHWLCKNLSERLGQRKSEVAPIQKCAVNEWETAGYWGDYIKFIAD